MSKLVCAPPSLFGALYDRLADHPDIGALRPVLGRGIRISVVAPYLIIHGHIERDDAVTVLRIVHGRRKITGKMIAEFR